jgi:glycosyltransferase involved in cell wall biosynthesis
MPNRPDVALMLFDLSVTGVAKNAVRVANAAHAAGLKVEIWTAQSSGDLRAAVDPAIPQLSLGAELPPGYSRHQRKLASNALTDVLASFYAERRPMVALSAGNHFHDLAANARRVVDRRDMRLLGRVSNAAPNAMRTAMLLKVLKKRRAASARYAQMDHLIAVSREIRDELVTGLRVDPAKISLIRNGVDIARVQEQSKASLPDWPWTDDAPVILGVGRLAAQKNFELLVEAFAIARRQRPLRLAILGSGPEGAHEELLAHALSLGVSDDIWLPGHVSNPFPYYGGAGLFVLSSRWEGMSNVLLEAIACGCPVVAARSAVGSAEILDDGKFGKLATARPRPLAKAILQALADRIPPDTLVARAKDFDLEATLGKYVSLLETEVAKAAMPTK